MELVPVPSVISPELVLVPSVTLGNLMSIVAHRTAQAPEVKAVAEWLLTATGFGYIAVAQPDFRDPAEDRSSPLNHGPSAGGQWRPYSGPPAPGQRHSAVTDSRWGQRVGSHLIKGTPADTPCLASSRDKLDYNQPRARTPEMGQLTASARNPPSHSLLGRDRSLAWR